MIPRARKSREAFQKREGVPGSKKPRELGVELRKDNVLLGRHLEKAVHVVSSMKADAYWNLERMRFFGTLLPSWNLERMCFFGTPSSFSGGF